MASSYNYTFYFFHSLKENACKDNKALEAEVAFNVQVTLAISSISWAYYAFIILRRELMTTAELMMGESAI